MAKLFSPHRDPLFNEPVEPAWPASLTRPSAELIYLDLNHWINLAKADSGHPGGEPFKQSLFALRAARRERRALFPLSATHYMEVAKIKDPKQRRQIAKIMEELSDLACLTSPFNLRFAELTAALDRHMSVHTPLAEFSLIGSGVGFAFGFDLEIDHPTEMKILSGPRDEEVPELRAKGWNIESFIGSIHKRAADHQAFADSLDSSWRKGRMRDIVSTRDFLSERMMIALALVRREHSFDEIFPAHEDDLVLFRSLARAMPSLETSVLLQCRVYSQPQSRWTINTVFDIDALSVAVPYCDVVLTDGEFAHAVQAAKLDRTMGTKILQNLQALCNHLRNHS